MLLKETYGSSTDARSKDLLRDEEGEEPVARKSVIVMELPTPAELLGVMKSVGEGFIAPVEFFREAPLKGVGGEILSDAVDDARLRVSPALYAFSL